MKRQQQIALVLLLLSLLGFGVPKGVHKKVVKEVGKTFEVEGLQLEPIIISDPINQKLPTEITGDNLYKVIDQGNLLGYAFADQAPSKTAKFDYLVIFDQEWTVLNSKVLVYREEYGGEIGSKRWLKQFLGKTPNDRVDMETNIDAISGATISVRSMTLAVDNLFQSIAILRKNESL